VRDSERERRVKVTHISLDRRGGERKSRWKKRRRNMNDDVEKET
jgi:hypothetical protein